jgi:hypothetical protein
MIVGPCFDGDVDMALAGVQHDLYFASPEAPHISIGGGSTLWWIWRLALSQAAASRGTIPWIDRNLERLRAVDGFSHKELVLPHEHIAAYFRWTTPRIARPWVHDPSSADYPTDLLEAWRGFLRRDIPDLLYGRDALVSLCKLILYRNFDASDGPRAEFHDVLMRRYGHECVTRTWWAAEVAARTGVGRPGLGKAEGE